MKPKLPSKSFISQISSLAGQEELGWRELDCVSINTVWGLSGKLCQSGPGSFITGLGSEQCAVWLLWFIQNSCQGVGGPNHSTSSSQWLSANRQRPIYFVVFSIGDGCAFWWAPNTAAPLWGGTELKGKLERDFRGEEKRGREGESKTWNPRPAPAFISGVPVI